MTPTAFAHELRNLRDKVWTTAEYIVFLDMARLHTDEDLEAEYDNGYEDGQETSYAQGFEDGQRDAEDK